MHVQAAEACLCETAVLGVGAGSWGSQRWRLQKLVNLYLSDVADRLDLIIALLDAHAVAQQLGHHHISHSDDVVVGVLLLG